MPLQNEDGFFHRNLTVCRRSVALSVEFRVVRLVLLEHIVDRRKEHSGNGNNGFLVPTALFESQVAITDFRELLGTNGTERTLNKQWLDVSTGSTDSGGFLLCGVSPAQEQRCFEVGNTDISTPISEIMPIAAKDWIPGAGITRPS